MVDEVMHAAGAVVAGSTVYDQTQGWATTPRSRCLPFVPTHRPHDVRVAGETTFTFVPDIEMAKDAAGDKNVYLMGGATTVNRRHVQALSTSCSCTSSQCSSEAEPACSTSWRAAHPTRTDPLVRGRSQHAPAAPRPGPTDTAVVPANRTNRSRAFTPRSRRRSRARARPHAKRTNPDDTTHNTARDVVGDRALRPHCVPDNPGQEPERGHPGTPV